MDRRPATDDPRRDLVECGATVYRRFVLDHPSLYRIAFQRVVPGLAVTDELHAAREEAFGRLERRVERLAQAAGVDHGRIRAAAVEFNAMCEGLANAELRGGTPRALPAGEETRVWREALQTVVRGLAPTA